MPEIRKHGSVIVAAAIPQTSCRRNRWSLENPLEPGPFEFRARLGEGGQGVVYLGRGTDPRKAGRIKVLWPSVDAAVLQRLACELDVVRQVQPTTGDSEGSTSATFQNNPGRAAGLTSAAAVNGH